MPSGGGSGPASVNYNDLIASKYYNAWVVPPGLDSGATVKVSVTISRDGSVVSSRIIKSSGDRLLDESIRGALDSVQFIEAFPDSFRESQRTVTINFNPQIKQQTG
jgi:TonB family protein